MEVRKVIFVGKRNQTLYGITIPKYQSLAHFQLLLEKVVGHPVKRWLVRSATANILPPYRVEENYMPNQGDTFFYDDQQEEDSSSPKKKRKRMYRTTCPACECLWELCDCQSV